MRGSRSRLTDGAWPRANDFETLTPAASIYNVETGELLRRFDRPALEFAAVPPYLRAYDSGQGTPVWDPSTDERLLHDAPFSPITAHPDSHEPPVLYVRGRLRVSKLVSG
jgi:hypothetical protein